MNTYNRKELTAGIELLAPAGDMNKLDMAIRYGADAVYLGTTSYSLRAASGNFDLEYGLPAAVEKAHENGLPAYATMNILAAPSDFHMAETAVKSIADSGADAIIVSDPGMFTLVRETRPEMEIHISTQASVTNARACIFWYQQGARRIVLARELSLQDIIQIKSEIPEDLELEAFVHGAMCMAWSGRCMLSAHLTGRSANKGACTQTCRWKFQSEPAPQYLLTEMKRPEDQLLMEEDQRGTYIFNAKDMCMIEHIPALIMSGIRSFKIEGRTKSPFYVATVVKAYRQAIDAYAKDPDHYKTDPDWLRDLTQTVHRPFDTGFYFTSPQQDAKVFEDDTMIREAAVVGMVKGWLPESGLVLIEQRNKISLGDELELIQPRGKHIKIKADSILDLEKNPIDSTPHPQMLYYLPMKEHVSTGAFIRRSGDKDVSARL